MNETQLFAYFDRISDAPGSIQCLRRFILDLAVRGKLVEQDTSDEPASALLLRANPVSSVRDNLDGSPGTEKHDDHPFKVPLGWAWTRLGDVCSKTGSGSTPRGGKSVYQATGVPFLRSQNVYDDGLRLDDVAYITNDTHQRMSGTALQGNDLLLNITGGSIGRCCLVSRDLGDANVSQHVAIIRVAIEGIQAYLHVLIRSPYFQQFVNDEQTGAGRGGLPKNRMDRIPIALPPLAEQRRIVVKVHELMERCDGVAAAYLERESARNRLTAASLHRINNCTDQDAFRQDVRFCLTHLPRLAVYPEQIKQIRQTIFNLAIRGLLAPQDPKHEASRRLLGERALALDAKIEPWKLPCGWSWSSLNLIGETLGGGTPSKAVPDFWTGAIPWVSPKDMKIDLIKDAQDHISEAAIEQSAARLIPTGALLMVVRGMILAHSFPTAITAVPVTINQDMKAIIPFTAELIDFLLLLTKGLKPEVLRLVQHSTHGTCKLLTEDLFSLPIPIPPIAEQRRIVAKVKELMRVCDKLETQLDVTKTEAGRLLESVLHHALQTIGDSATAPIPELASCG